MRYVLALAWVILVSVVAGVSIAADYTRDGGAADWCCCADKGCAEIISQHADEVRAFKACERLTDADGKTRYTRSNAFRVTRVVVTNGTASLYWTPPTQNTDGTALTDLASYRIVYGRAAGQLVQSVQIPAPASSHVMTGLDSGTWYFAVIAVATNPSAPSNVASKSVT